MTREAIDDLVIRDARDEDRAAIRELTLRVYDEYADVMEPSAWEGLERAVSAALKTDQPVERIVAERNGQVVGSVQLWPPVSDAYGGEVTEMPWPEVRLLAVAPEARGDGIGKTLMDECVRRARRSGASAIGLHTSRSMVRAIRMYERMGFERTPEFDFQPPGAELVTAYRLRLG